MIKIDKLKMHLPAGFQHRAVSISKLVGDLLQQQYVSQNISLDSVSLSPMKISVDVADAEIANLIVRQLVSSTKRQPR